MNETQYPTDEELLTRLRSHEDQFVERKEAVQRDALKEAVVAFANTVVAPRTGVIFLGVTDDGEPSGKLGQFDATMRTTVMRHIDECYPPIRYSLVALTLMDASGSSIPVAAVVISESDARPHFAGGAWVRVGVTTRRATEEQFQRLVEDRLAPVRFLRPHVGKLISVYRESVSQRGIAFWQGPIEARLVVLNNFFVTVHTDPSTADVSFALSRVEIEWDNRPNIDRPVLRVRL